MGGPLLIVDMEYSKGRKGWRHRLEDDKTTINLFGNNYGVMEMFLRPVRSQLYGDQGSPKIDQRDQRGRAAYCGSSTGRIGWNWIA